MLDIKWIGSPFAYDRRDGSPLAAVWHIAQGSLDGCDGWFNDLAGNKDGLAAHAAIARFKRLTVHQYVQGRYSAHACGITDGEIPVGHGFARWLIDRIGIGSPNRFTYNIETEGRAGWRLDADVLETAIEYGYFLWCTGGSGGVSCEHDFLNPDHGILKDQPCDRYHNLRHGEIGGHPLCPGYTEDELATLIAGINAKLRGRTPVMPAWALAAANTQDFEEDDMQTHSLDSGQTNDALNEIAKSFGSVMFDDQGATMLAVTEAKGIAIPAGRKAVLVIY